MLEHNLSDIMDDNHDFGRGGGGGATAKGAHTVLLCRMQEGRVSWSDTHKIDRIRRGHAQKVSHPIAMHTNRTPPPHVNTTKSLSVLTKEIMITTGGKYDHALKDCRNTAKKNRVRHCIAVRNKKSKRS